MREQIRAMQIGILAGLVILMVVIMLFNTAIAGAATAQVRVTAYIPQVFVYGEDTGHVMVQTNMPNVKMALVQEGFVYVGRGVYQAPVGTDFVVPAS